jgi:hypothetical protein
MAPIVAGAALLYQGYQAIAANQVSQAAKGKANATLATQAKVPANEAAKASVAAASAQTVANARAKGATGQSSTILTGPIGAPPAPIMAKTLIGQ